MLKNSNHDRMIAYSERLASFEGVRLPRKRKKTQWPHEHPDPEQLARAGFYFNPTAESPDNVTCFLCECSLDGWEIDDCPLKEHLEHSRGCSWATMLSKEWKNEKNHDPHCKENVGMRLTTFDNRWPLEKKRGWPTSLKLAEAGFYFAPTVADEDLVVCAYCDLSLDGWERTDDPLHEHQRRRPECYFFTSQEGKGCCSKKKKSLKRASSRVEPLIEEVVSDEEPDNKPIRSKKEGKKASVVVPKIRQVSVEDELAKLQKEMEERGELSEEDEEEAEEEEEEEEEADSDIDRELEEMAAKARTTTCKLDDEEISVFEQPQQQFTPVRPNKRSSNVFVEEDTPPVKKRKSSQVPPTSDSAPRLSLAISESSNNWEVFSCSSEEPEEPEELVPLVKEETEEVVKEEPVEESVEESVDDVHVADESVADEIVANESVADDNVATDSVTDDNVQVVSPYHESKSNIIIHEDNSEDPTESEQTPSFEHSREVTTESQIKGETEVKSPIAQPTDTQPTLAKVLSPKTISRSPLAVRNLNQIASSKSTVTINATTPPRLNSGVQWEPVDCDQVFDVCQTSPQKDSEYLDMTISEWYTFQAAEAESRLMEKCHRMVEIVQREGQRALNYLKLLPTTDRS